MTIRRCPRCGESFDDRYPAASRTTPGRDVDICGKCGDDEAWLLLAGDPVPPMAAWPVTRKYDAPPSL